MKTIGRYAEIKQFARSQGDAAYLGLHTLSHRDTLITTLENSTITTARDNKLNYNYSHKKRARKPRTCQRSVSRNVCHARVSMTSYLASIACTELRKQRRTRASGKLCYGENRELQTIWNVASATPDSHRATAVNRNRQSMVKKIRRWNFKLRNCRIRKENASSATLTLHLCT